MKWFKTKQKLNTTRHESPWTAAMNVTRVLSSTVSAAAALNDEFIFYEVFINNTFIQASLYQVQLVFFFSLLFTERAD